MTFKQLLSNTKGRMILVAAGSGFIALMCELNAFHYATNSLTPRHSGASGGACGFAILSGLALVCYTLLEIDEKRKAGTKNTPPPQTPVTPASPEGDKDELAGP